MIITLALRFLVSTFERGVRVNEVNQPTNQPTVLTRMNHLPNAPGGEELIPDVDSAKLVNVCQIRST